MKNFIYKRVATFSNEALLKLNYFTSIIKGYENRWKTTIRQNNVLRNLAPHQFVATCTVIYGSVAIYEALLFFILKNRRVSCYQESFKTE